MTGRKAARKPTKPAWRKRFAAVRAALCEAEKLTGKARTKALVAVCRALIDAEEDPPVPWRRDACGAEWRVRNASTRAYDRAERALEQEVSRAIGGRCPACFIDEPSVPRRPVTNPYAERLAKDGCIMPGFRGPRVRMTPPGRGGWWTAAEMTPGGLEAKGRNMLAAYEKLERS